MAAKVRYNVCVARKYRDNQGKEKTHFWTVGKAFIFERQDGSKGINVELWSRTLMVDSLVLFEDKGAERIAQAVKDRPNQQEDDTPNDDDIPF
jgi:hypothetical protein